MSDYLLTYEDACKIAEKYNNNNFRKFSYMIRGYKVEAFDYFICGWEDFKNPLPDKPEVEAFDMRGTTFVFDKDGKLWKRFFMLPKFFNINQVEATQYGNIKNKEILNITAKEDGSLVAFMMTPDEKLFAKTIGSFVSEQSQLAYSFLYKWEEKVLYVKKVLKMGFTPLFEYVSGPNRIVLKYTSEDLRFLGLRDNNTGDWIPACGLKDKDKIPFNKPEYLKNTSLDSLIEKSKSEENKEGWVVGFKDLMVKIKTAWYFNLHGLRTENVFREDYIIKNYLAETLDDIMSQLDPKEDKDAFDFVKRTINSVNNYMVQIDTKTKALKTRFENEFNSEWNSFAKSCHKEPYFGLSRTLIENPDEYMQKKIEMILKKTYRLKSAKELVDRWENTSI
jgi:T4 RnlA family RNA ligase